MQKLFTDPQLKIKPKVKEKYLKQNPLKNNLALVDVLYDVIISHPQLKAKNTRYKNELFETIALSKLAMKHIEEHTKNPGKVKKWLTDQLKESTPIWDAAWDSPIRDAWMREQLEQESWDEDRKLHFASVEICSIKVDDKLPYSFDPNQQIAIWFSTNPQVALREKEKQCLINRGLHNPVCTNTLIYSSAILNTEARKDMIRFAKKHKIILIDIDHLDMYLSPVSRELLELVKTELSMLGKGGNPAAASDLIRWIPEIMEGNIYADIDLPLDPAMKGKKLPPQKAGLPVVLNMGSITRRKGKHREEALSMNTDIIAFSDHHDTTVFMEHTALEIVKAYKDPFTALEKADKLTGGNIGICHTKAFNKIKMKNGTLFDLRQAVSACVTINDFYLLLGKDQFQKEFKLTTQSLTNLELHIRYNAKLLLLQTKDGSNLNEKMNEVRQKYFKPLVEEISGPGAILTAFGGAESYNNHHYRSKAELPTIKTRVMEGFACSNGMTAFQSDNIPPWQTPIDVFNKMTFNAEGLSWIPPTAK